jgi:hypothetical protein
MLPGRHHALASCAATTWLRLAAVVKDAVPSLRVVGARLRRVRAQEPHGSGYAEHSVQCRPVALRGSTRRSPVSCNDLCTCSLECTALHCTALHCTKATAGAATCSAARVPLQARSPRSRKYCMHASWLALSRAAGRCTICSFLLALL